MYFENTHNKSFREQGTGKNLSEKIFLYQVSLISHIQLSLDDFCYAAQKFISWRMTWLLVLVLELEQNYELNYNFSTAIHSSPRGET
ncbi:MAG: hypothetical protein F6K24_34870 [Okeania sp. SIO2D1]|nr:hypothetical protein [Okeania sp. SIO2D1]